VAERTGISWADATFNPWLGCQKVSPACDHCYAEELCTTRLNIEWGPHGARRRTADSTWGNLRRWNRRPENLGAPEGTKPFVFGGSLCDVFDNKADPAWRADYFAAIRDAPNLLFLLLTKRPQNIVGMVERACGDEGLPGNVALGTTVEDRLRLGNLNHLQRAAASFRPAFIFGSFEPLLEHLGDISTWLRERWYCRSCRIIFESRETAVRKGSRECPRCVVTGLCDQLQRLPPLDWVIGGGESGKHARPAPEGAFHSLRDQSLAHGAIYHHKQNGSRGPDKGGKLLDGELLQARPEVLA
jgi:protein gp37